MIENKFLNRYQTISTLTFLVFGLLGLLYFHFYLNEPKIEYVEVEKIVEKTHDFEYSKIIDEVSVWIYNRSSKLPLSHAQDITRFVYQNCQYPKLVLAIIRNESNFDQFAYRDDTKVYGLGQIRYHIWADQIRQFGINEPRDLYDAQKNILAINYIVVKYYNQTRNLNQTLTKYVGGTHNDYVNKVLSDVGELSLIEETYIRSIIINKFETDERKIVIDYGFEGDGIIEQEIEETVEKTES